MGENQILREKLTNRLNTLSGTSFSSFHEAAQRFFVFFDNEPPCIGLSSDLRDEFPDMETRLEHYLGNPDQRFAPVSDKEAAAFGELFLRKIIVSTSAPRNIYKSVYDRMNTSFLPVSQDVLDEKMLSVVKELILSPFSLYVLEWASSLGRTHTNPANVDPLVQMLRKEELDNSLEGRCILALNQKQPLSLIFFDIDNFGKVNKTYGQHAGDDVLREFSSRVRFVVGQKGTCYRSGGEEFSILLENYTVDEAASLAERIRIHVSAEPILETRLIVTASFGIAGIPTHAEGSKDLSTKADEAMRNAKKRGKNLVVVSGEDAFSTSIATTTIHRKTASPLVLTDEQADSIRLDYLKLGRAYCPYDDVMLEIQPFYADDVKAPFLSIYCPYCGLERMSNPHNP